jgi:hypothetical protein
MGQKSTIIYLISPGLLRCLDLLEKKKKKKKKKEKSKKKKALKKIEESSDEEVKKPKKQAVHRGPQDLESALRNRLFKHKKPNKGKSKK